MNIFRFIQHHFSQIEESPYTFWCNNCSKAIVYNSKYEIYNKLYCKLCYKKVVE